MRERRNDSTWKEQEKERCGSSDGKEKIRQIEVGPSVSRLAARSPAAPSETGASYFRCIKTKRADTNFTLTSRGF